MNPKTSDSVQRVVVATLIFFICGVLGLAFAVAFDNGDLEMWQQNKNKESSQEEEIRLLKERLRNVETNIDGNENTKAPTPTYIPSTPTQQKQSNPTSNLIKCDSDKCNSRMVTPERCEASTCCEVGGEWSWYDSKAQCENAQRSQKKKIFVSSLGDYFYCTHEDMILNADESYNDAVGDFYCLDDESSCTSNCLDNYEYPYSSECIENCNETMNSCQDRRTENLDKQEKKLRGYVSDFCN